MLTFTLKLLIGSQKKSTPVAIKTPRQCAAYRSGGSWCDTKQRLALCRDLAFDEVENVLHACKL